MTQASNNTTQLLFQHRLYDGKPTIKKCFQEFNRLSVLEVVVSFCRQVNTRQSEPSKYIFKRYITGMYITGMSWLYFITVIVRLCYFILTCK